MIRTFRRVVFDGKEHFINEEVVRVADAISGLDYDRLSYGDCIKIAHAAVNALQKIEVVS